MSRKKFTAKAQCQNKLRAFWNYIPTFLRCSNDSYYTGLFEENDKKLCKLSGKQGINYYHTEKWSAFSYSSDRKKNGTDAKEIPTILMVISVVLQENWIEKLQKLKIHIYHI